MERKIVMEENKKEFEFGIFDTCVISLLTCINLCCVVQFTSDLLKSLNEMNVCICSSPHGMPSCQTKWHGYVV